MTSQLQVETVTGARSAPVVGPRSTRALLVGMCGLFGIWMLVVPPYGGIDEFDHAYRAAAAARGQWLIEPTDATRGTGAFLTVPTDIVEAARPQCEALKYTKPVDCVGVDRGENRVVASGAGRYHPLFYAVIGTAALPFHGATALYAMRLATASLALLFVALAVAATRTWARSLWPYLGIVVAGTPIALYSSSIAAPNGLEMMAALALWTSLVGLMLAPPEKVTGLATTAAAGGAVLATLRPLGPLWCLLIAAGVLVAVRVPTSRLRLLLSRPAVRIGALVVFLSALQSTIWVLAVDALRIGVEPGLDYSLTQRIGLSAQQVPNWIMQCIAAFPLRGDASHPLVYACYFGLFGFVLVLGWRSARLRPRLALLAIIVFALGFPYVSTVQSLNTYGSAWQGRYGLPLTMGLVLLATMSMDRSGTRVRGPARLVLFLLYVVAQTTSIVYALVIELRFSPQVGSTAWVQPPMVLAATWAAAASALLWWGASGVVRPIGVRHRDAD